MRRRSPANHRRLAGFRRAPPPRGRSADQRLGNPRESSSAAEGSAEGRAPRLSLFFLCPLYNSTTTWLLSPISSSPRCKAPSLLHLPLPLFPAACRCPLLSLSLSWSGRRLAASLPSGSLSRRPPRLILFLSLPTPASDGPDPLAVRSRIRRPRSRGATVARPAALGSGRWPHAPRTSPTRNKISAPPFLPPQAWGRHRHVAVGGGLEKSKRPPAVAGGWG
ncbi:hypothetical protein SEVIR_2G371201v4 [Setaria viridis]